MIRFAKKNSAAIQWDGGSLSARLDLDELMARTGAYYSVNPSSNSLEIFWSVWTTWSETRVTPGQWLVCDPDAKRPFATYDDEKFHEKFTVLE